MITWLRDHNERRGPERQAGFYGGRSHGTCVPPMFETLNHVLEAPESKAVVWDRNSHIGDARFTDLGARS